MHSRGGTRTSEEAEPRAHVTDDAAADGSGVEADAQAQRLAARAGHLLRGSMHVERQAQRGARVVSPRRQHARHAHVRVADGLHLHEIASVSDVAAHP